MNVKSIVLDLDGTLFNSSRHISTRNQEALRKCHAKGLHIIIATARPPRAIQHLPVDILSMGYILYYNGALITHVGKGIREHTAIPSPTAMEIIDFVHTRESTAFITLEHEDRWYELEPLKKTEYTTFGIGPDDPKPKPIGIQKLGELSPTKILVARFQDLQGIISRFSERVNILCTDRGSLIQIMEHSVSKESAVEHVLMNLGVTPDVTMVFGDDMNDLGLFHLCGFPVAMGNAIQELKTVAKLVTTTNDEDGVALALERLVLVEHPATDKAIHDDLNVCSMYEWGVLIVGRTVRFPRFLESLSGCLEQL